MKRLLNLEKDVSVRRPDEMDECGELSQIASQLDDLEHQFVESGIVETVDRVVKIISEVDKAFFQSWLGDHSRLYYQDLQLPPPGKHFNPVRGKTLDF